MLQRGGIHGKKGESFRVMGGKHNRYRRGSGSVCYKAGGEGTNTLSKNGEMSIRLIQISARRDLRRFPGADQAQQGINGDSGGDSNHRASNFASVRTTQPSRSELREEQKREV